MLALLAKFLLGGGLNGLAGQMRQAYERKLEAQNDNDRLAADLDMARIEAALHAAEVANEDRWSATSLGRYLIVLPFGAWYAVVLLDSIFTFTWDVQALPPQVMELSIWLFPAIIIGDVGRSLFRRRK